MFNYLIIGSYSFTEELKTKMYIATLLLFNLDLFEQL